MQTMTQKKGKSGILIYGLYMYYRNLLKMKGNLDRKSDFNVTFKEFYTVLSKFNTKVKDAIIYDSWVFVMPYRLGTLYIKKIKMKFKLNQDGSVDKRGLVPDWPKTLKLWAKLYPCLSKEELKKIPNKKLVFYLNEHTFGYKFVIHWQKRCCNIINNGPYEFVFAKGNRRELASVLKSNPNITYYE